jgi:flagellar motor switch protein FliN/FliY
VANDNDDPLDPAEIEALLSSAGGGVPGPGPGTTPSPGGIERKTAAPPAGQPMASADIDELLRDRPRREMPVGDPEALLERAAADLAAAVAPGLKSSADRLDPAAGARPFDFRPFDQGPSAGLSGELSNLKDVELDLRIELGRTELLIDEVLKLREGSVVALDKLAGDPVDILVNGRLIARGEVLVLNDNFCVRIAEILAPALQ